MPEKIINQTVIDKYITSYKENPNTPFNEKFYRELWGNFTNNKCILGSCDEKSIESHLYPKGYLLKNGGIFENSGVKSKKTAKSLSTPLFCEKHDNNLFKSSDEINDFTDLIKEKDGKCYKLENYFEKLLFFKYKTLIIQLNCLMFEITQGIGENQEKYNLLLIQFEKISKEIENYNKTGKINISIIYAGYIGLFDSEKYTLFSNICFIDESNIPFGLILNQDKGGITLGICIYGEDYPIDLVRKIKTNIQKIKEIFDCGNKHVVDDLINYIKKDFKLEEFYNRTMFLNRDIIDVGLYSNF